MAKASDVDLLIDYVTVSEEVIDDDQDFSEEEQSMWVKRANKAWALLSFEIRKRIRPDIADLTPEEHEEVMAEASDVEQ